MLFNFLENHLPLILTLAVFTCILALFLFKELYRKIACLACCFSCVILLFFVISFNSTKHLEILSILVSIIIISCATIAVGIAIIDRIYDKEN